ncbi:hypothetical protein ES705_47776 [subsurface metagenome]
MKSKILVVVLVMFLVLALAGCGVVPPFNQSPNANFTATPVSGVVPLEVYFNASNSYDPDGTIVSYSWNFKDGDAGNGEIVNHTFSSTGNYDVRLTVTDNEGATDSTTKLITVTEPPNQFMENISFENRTANALSVQITSTYIETSVDSFTIEPGLTEIIKSEYGIIPAFIVSVIGQPSLKVRYSEYNHSRKVVFWNTYEYKVEYKISGTAKSVSVTLSNPTGGTEQYSDVDLPKSYSYKYFSDNFLYISAQNNGETGTVNVKCYYKGQLKDSAHSEGAYVIATASYYISNY